ncbi:TLR4 interactor with leucine rich repeats-like [Branchiostoma lanceolatum]|uniref:TLR4 interactor with leucine rich repeats-like n=1 Tax=Branchiostoma lanceolatum TaxID=7740 RepID=UPI0034511C0D
MDMYSLQDVPPDLPASILRLDLQGSWIKELHRQPFDALKNLQYLDLRGNRIEYIENGTFASVINLRTLNLSRNGLGDSQWSNISSSLPSLQTLILSDNRLQQLNGLSFSDLRNLTFLDLSSNAIIVGECALCGQQRLQRLDLTDNEISTLPNRLFHPQSEIEILDLSNNRLQDDVLEKEELWSGLARLRKLDRNFLPGAPIVNNIVKAIETSRKTIYVLTRSFLRSGWCEFELQLAQTPDNLFGKGGSCRLILVFLERIPRPLLKKYKHLEAVMDRDTYLEWGPPWGNP